MTYTEFKNKWLGKGINYDGAFGNQCMDVYRMYVKEVLQIPQSKPVVGAKDVWNTYLPEFFERITNNPNDLTQIPQQGDIVIWGMNPYGHIGVCESATSLTVTCFEQNWTELDGSGVTEIRRHNYNNVLGWLKFKKTMAENYTEEELRILAFVREKKLTEGQVREGYGLIADNVSKKIADLEALVYKKSEEIDALSQKVAEERKIALGWQSKYNTANDEIKSLKIKLLEATNLSAWEYIKTGIELLIRQKID